jgi:hypothetical protein
MCLVVRASECHIETRVVIEYMVPADGRYINPAWTLLFADTPIV